MNSKMAKGFASFWIVLTSVVTAASPDLDMIHTNDGSIFKGEIVLQDFANKQYKIKLTNGQYVTLFENDIKKITKSFDQPYSNQQSLDKTSSTSAPSVRRKEWTIGLLRHTVKHDYNKFYDYTLKEKFKGLKISHRKVVRSLLSFRSDLEVASEEHVESIFDTLDKDYLSISSYLTLGNQPDKGFQAYIGAGVFIGHYFMSGDDQSNIGGLATTGIGYKHRRLSALMSGRYFGGTASSSSNIQNIDKIYSVSLDFTVLF